MKRLLFLPVLSLCLWTSGADAAGYLPNTAADVTAGTGICNFTGEYYSDHFYDLIQASGVKIIRVSFGWDTIEKLPGEYQYDTINLYDDVIDKCAQRGIRVMGTLGNTNPLYGDGYQPYQPEYYGTQSFRDGFSNFAADAVAHYKDYIAQHYPDQGLDPIWELWNEPNGGGFWAGNSPTQYMALANQAISAMRDADVNATIIAPATALVEGNVAYNLSWDDYGNPIVAGQTDTREYLTTCFNQGLLAPGMVDGITVHNYRYGAPESVVNGNIPTEYSSNALDTYAKVRTLMNDYTNGANVKVLNGEWGYAVGNPGITTQSQADYLARMMLSDASYKDGSQTGIPMSMWFQWRDMPVEWIPPGGDPNNPYYHYGMVDGYLNPKPAFYAMKTFNNTLAGFHYRDGYTSATDSYMVFEAANGYQLEMAAWTTDNSTMVRPNEYWGTYLACGTPLYLGQQLAWDASNGGNNGNWSESRWYGSNPWMNGYQAQLNAPDTYINVDGEYTVSGLQIGANNVVLDHGKLRFTSGGGNIYVAGGFSQIASVIADAVDRQSGDDAMTYTNTPATFVLRKCGAGELGLSGNNTFHGSILVGEGYLDLGHDNALGDTANPLTFAGGGIDFNGHSPTTGTLAIVADGVVMGNYRPDTFSRYTFANSTIGNNFTVAGTGNLELAGRLASDHNVTLTKADSGTLTLSGDTDNAGLGLNVTAGTVNLNKNNAGGVHAVGGAGIAAINLGATVRYTGYTGAGDNQIYGGSAIALTGGTLDFNGHNQSGTHTVTVSTPNSTIANTAAGTTSTFSLSRINMNQNMTVNAVGDLTISGRITYTTNYLDPIPICTLTKNGAGLLTLNNETTSASRYRGGTTINKGNLLFATVASHPSYSTTLINAGGALVAAGAYNTVADWLHTDTLGRINPDSHGALALAADNSENISMGSYASLSIGSTGNHTYSGMLTPANNTYRLGGGGGTITIANPLVNNGTTNRSLIISGNVTLAGANTYSGPTTINNGALRIAASGSLNDSLTGGITLNGGTLLVSSTAPLTRSITMIGGTVGGTGRYVGNLTPGNGHLSPGDGGVGTMTQQGNLTMDDSSVFDFDLGSTPGVSDRWAFDGAGCSLTLDGTLNIATSGRVAAGNYVLFSGATSITDNGLDFGIVPTSHDWSYAVANNNGVYSVIVTAAPEPGTLVLLGTGLVGLLAYVWRKRKQV